MKQDPHPPRQGGFTLMELLIVVGVLAVVLGLGLPSLRKFSEKGELLDAARGLRAELLATRLAAIEGGGPAYFRYQPGNGAFATIKPQAVQRGSPAAARPLLDDSVGEMEEAAAIEDSATQTLPAAVRFVDIQAAGTALPSGAPDSADGEWSLPVIFYPNGRALNAQIRLATGRYQVDVIVRGLTGTVQVSQIERIAGAAEDAGGQEALP